MLQITPVQFDAHGSLLFQLLSLFLGSLSLRRIALNAVTAVKHKQEFNIDDFRFHLSTDEYTTPCAQSPQTTPHPQYIYTQLHTIHGTSTDMTYMQTSMLHMPNIHTLT